MINDEKQTEVTINVENLSRELLNKFDEIMNNLPQGTPLDIGVLIAFAISKGLAAYAVIRSLQLKAISPNDLMYGTVVDAYLGDIKKLINDEKFKIAVH
jgi:hypothetical protein